MNESQRLLSCDWGTSSLRLRLVAVGPVPRILAEYRGGEGAAALAAMFEPAARAARFQRALGDAAQELSQRTVEQLKHLPVIVSGMAGSSIGWVSLPYARLPFDLNGGSAVSARVNFEGRPVLLVSGVRDELDVMRGEETELIGLMQLPDAQRFATRCMVILPGTHSKHVEIVDGRITAFRTLMTGELFSVLASHSVLRHSVREGEQPVALPRDVEGPAAAAFAEGVRGAIGGDLLSLLFRTRTRQLLQDQPPALNAVYLSGLLIGSEIGTLLRRAATDVPIVLCAGSAVSGWYAAAMRTAGLDRQMTVIAPEIVDVLSVCGHCRLYKTNADI